MILRSIFLMEETQNIHGVDHCDESTITLVDTRDNEIVISTIYTQHNVWVITTLTLHISVYLSYLCLKHFFAVNSDDISHMHYC